MRGLVCCCPPWCCSGRWASSRVRGRRRRRSSRCSTCSSRGRGGDHLAIAGVGFPEGKTAHIAFRGDLVRPGAAPVQGVEVDVDAVVTSGTEIELPFDATLQKLFAGAGDRVAHTTFSGDLTVAFAASKPAAPPVAGTLHDMWLDVRPPMPHRAVAEAETAEGERTLAFLGIKASTVTGRGRRHPRRLGGAKIAGRHRASAGRRRRDGVRWGARPVRARPHPGAGRARGVAYRSGAAVVRTRRLRSSRSWGSSPAPRSALLGPVLILGLATIVLLLFFAPMPAVAAWLERTIAMRLQARAPGRTGRQSRFGASLRARLAVGVASTLFAFLAFTHYLGLGEVDVGILFVVATTSLATLGLVTGGQRPAGRYSLLAGLGTAARVVSLGVPAAAALVAVVIMTGSLRMEEHRSRASRLALGLDAVQEPSGLRSGRALVPDRSRPGEHRPSPITRGAPCHPLRRCPPRERGIQAIHRRRLGSDPRDVCRCGGALLRRLAESRGWLPSRWRDSSAGRCSAPRSSSPRHGSLSSRSLLLAVRCRPSTPIARCPCAGDGWCRCLCSISCSRRRGSPGGQDLSAETLAGAVMLAVTAAVMLHVVLRVRAWRSEPESDLDPFV